LYVVDFVASLPPWCRNARHTITLGLPMLVIVREPDLQCATGVVVVSRGATLSWNDKNDIV